MTTFVLVHGAWHGAWSWGYIKAELEKDKHTVLTPDLPSHGDDTTFVDDVTLNDYVDKVVGIIDKQDEPVILVGHSMGGIVISRVAEQRPDKIKKLVYLTAFLPRDGESLFALEDRNPKPTVPPSLVIAENEKSATLQSDKIVNLFYLDCDDKDREFAIARLSAQPLAPFATPVSLTEENFGRVPRIYIECTNDQAISIELQRDMYTTSPCDKVFSLDTSHSPFLSAPVELAAILNQL